MKTRLLWLPLLLLVFAIDVHAQCDPALDPVDDGTGVFGPVVISEIKPGPGGFVEYYNLSASPFNLSSWWLCSPFTYTPAGAIVVPAGGYATVPWPAFFNDTPAGGEIQLYRSSNFGLSTDIVDFVCWGVNPHGTRISQALAVGKWTGGCAPVLTGGSIHRKIGTKGTSAADYDVASPPSPMNCVPGPTGIDDTPRYPSIGLSVAPNPFAALATLEFSLSSPAHVEASVYTVTGMRVRHLESADYPAGTARLLWDGTDADGRRLPSGAYFLRLTGNAAAVTTRVTIVR